MKRLLAVFASLLICYAFQATLWPAHAQQFVRPTAPFGVDAGQVSSVTTAFTGSAQTVTFTQPSTFITIFVQPSSSSAYISFNPGVAATTSNFLLPPGFGYSFESLPPLASISVLGTGSTGSFSVVAH